MDKKPVFLNKSLVIGVIVIFIGVVIQPVFAVDTDIESAYKSIECLIKSNSSYVQFPYEGLFVDQAVESDCYGSGGSNQIYSHMPIGQSFKPLYESHYGIELYFEDYNPQSPPAPIQISLKENTINGSIVAGTNVTLNLTSGSGWRFFEFSSPVNLTINETYVIDISTTISKWGIRRAYGSCYQRGISYMFGEPNPLGDLYFRTYVLSYPVANFTYSAEEPHVLFNGSSSYDRDGEIVSYDWDFGDGIIGASKITYHKYCEVGTYDVKLTVTDNDGLKDNITKSVDVLFENIPPSIPEISGSNSGKPGVEYEYVFNIIDPDGDDCRIWIGWGDGNSTGWKGPYPSGETLKLKHSWNETGTYVIKAKIMEYCDESLWGTLEVTIPRYRATSNPLLQWLFERFPNAFAMLRQLLKIL